MCSLSLSHSQVSVVADAVNTSGTTSLGQRPVVPECNLASDMDTLIEKGQFSDVTLSVGGAEFKAHKAILAGIDMLSICKFYLS